MKSFYWLSSYLTILGVSIHSVVHFWGTSGFWMRDFLLLGCIAAVALAVIDISAWRRNTPKRYATKEAVNEYMKKLFCRGGSISVYANNFAWLGASSELRQFLVREAKNGRQIRLFTPRPNEITNTLATSGGQSFYVRCRWSRTRSPVHVAQP